MTRQRHCSGFAWAFKRRCSDGRISSVVATRWKRLSDGGAARLQRAALPETY